MPASKHLSLRKSFTLYIHEAQQHSTDSSQSSCSLGCISVWAPPPLPNIMCMFCNRAVAPSVLIDRVEASESTEVVSWKCSMMQCDRCKQWGRGRHDPDICYLDILWPYHEPRNQPENLDISCMEVFHAMTGDKFRDCKREAGFNLFSAVGESVFSNLKLSLYSMASDQGLNGVSVNFFSSFTVSSFSLILEKIQMWTEWSISVKHRYFLLLCAFPLHVHTCISPPRSA